MRPKIKAKKKQPTEDSVFFQPALHGNKKYRHLFPGEMYRLTQVGRKNKTSKGY